MRRHWITVIALVLIAVGCVPLATPPAQASFPTGVFAGPGSWIAEYKADGTYVSQSSDAVERGTYTVTGEQVVVKGSYCGDVEGTYTWSFDGEALSFKAIDDQCADRRTAMVAGGSWFKQP